MKRIILLIILFFSVHNAFTQVFYFAKSSYGKNGIANTYVGNTMAVLPYGKIVVADSGFIARYQVDGGLDLSFGYSLAERNNMGIQAAKIKISSIAIQNDGKIVVAGFLGTYPHHYFAIARFFSEGNLDNTFSDDGIQVINFGSEDSYASSVAIQGDGKIVVGGYAYTDSSYNFAVARLNKYGNLDPDFSNDGKVITDFGKDEKASSMLLQGDGKIVIAGSSDTQIALARYNADGSLDNTFSNNGQQTFSVSGNNYKVKSVVAQADGKILVGGNVYDQTDHLFLARYNKDGSLDNTFSQGGMLVTESSDGHLGMAVTVQPDGKILLGGGIFDGTDKNFWLARFNPDGTRDGKFGKDGVAITDVSGGDDYITGLAISESKLYVVGNSDKGGAAMRYILDANNNYYPNVEITSPGDGWHEEGANIKIEAAATDVDGSISKVDFYLQDYYNKTTLIGTATQPPYTCTWNNAPSGNYYHITAKATDNNSLVTTTDVVNLDIDNRSIENTSAKPVVKITSPVANGVYADPTSLTITATAEDIDGSISKVELYNNSFVIATTTEKPYTFTLSPLPPGHYSFSVKATDNSLAVGTSDRIIDVFVYSPKKAPTVQLVSPVNNTSSKAPPSLTLAATAAGDYGYPVNRVEFYKNDTLVGSATSPTAGIYGSAYTFVLNSIPAGNYTFTAKAVSNDSTSAMSAPVNISLFDPDNAPFVRLTSPAPNETFTFLSSITIGATAANGNGAISKVEFYSDNNLIGTATESPYTFTLNNVFIGNYTITAKAFANDMEIAVSDPVHISVNYPNVAPSVSIKSAVDDTFTAPASITIEANASDADGSISKVEFYNNNTLIGTVTERPYTFAWNNIPAGNYSITAKATDNGSLVTISDPVHITVHNAKVSPTVTLTSPTANTTLLAPASITINASANDIDGSISKVEFYKNDILIGTATESPYTFTSNDIAAGNYLITAKAMDNDSLVTASAPVQVYVTNPKVAPTISITSPTVNSTFSAPASITVNANAYDPDGSISKVEFYKNDILIGTATESPYTFTWNDIPAGNYLITAKATDNDLLVGTSGPVQVYVTNPKVAPTVSITSPTVNTTNTTFTAPSSIAISATAADSDGSISKVDFYNNDTLIGTVAESPYTFTWKNVPTGHYSITAKATDNDLLVTTSETVKISVVPNKPPIVKVVNPINAARFTSPATIPIKVSATDIDGKISKVELYNGSTLLTTVTGDPYNYDWQNVAAGSYSISAVATDDHGLKTTSEVVNIIVSPKDSIAVKFAPNPASKTMAISTLGFDENKPITLSVISSGVTLKRIQLNNFSQTIQLDISSLVSGVYTLKLASGDKVVSKQFIKL